mmetsp:Transcript_2778/g.6654  ORF Transcript_2778/g.6654 Transcript_2778/m.6654 type:complete len:130 (-) Transcript_2778:37-426(-)
MSLAISVLLHVVTPHGGLTTAELPLEGVGSAPCRCPTLAVACVPGLLCSPLACADGAPAALAAADAAASCEEEALPLLLLLPPHPSEFMIFIRGHGLLQKRLFAELGGFGWFGGAGTSDCICASWAALL